ncbi:hypothetical protein [Paenibacillus sp. H1-7]|uniref:hypothetical protein n=1 Tax=Paenibacillus sp. H1-7 TaxID=2282849 RepID=UPI001EF8A5C0|nr:hypothetical protein [Paenibacillus sp. H1-7]
MKPKHQPKQVQAGSLLQSTVDSMDQLKELTELSADFKTVSISLANQKQTVSYYKSLINEKLLQDTLLHTMQHRTADAAFRRS